MGTTPELPFTFGQLWKGMNTIAVAQNAPLINTPNRSSSDLLRQARSQIIKGENRKGVLSRLRASTQRRAATVLPAPAPSSPAAPAAASGNGGSGYSGNNARNLGQRSNAGTTTAAAPRTSVNPAPSATPAAPPPTTPALPAPAPPAATVPPKQYP